MSTFIIMRVEVTSHNAVRGTLYIRDGWLEYLPV